jgi:O-antigen/teichoic acid export membrane protein
VTRFNNIITNTIGTYAGIGFAFLLTLVQFNTLARADFGALSVLLSLAYLLTNIFDFGTVATIYARVPELLINKQKTLYNFIKTVAIFQSTLGVIALSILLLIFSYIDANFLKTQTSFLSHALICCSILLFVWQNLLSNIFFAAKKFLIINLAMNASHIIKLALMMAAYYTHTLTIETTLVILGVVGPIFFISIIICTNIKDFLRAITAKFDLRLLTLKFTVTYFISTQIYSIATRLDLLFISYFFGGRSIQAGDYALAQRVVLAAASTIVSVTQVLSPFYSKLKTKKDIVGELKHSFTFLLIPVALFGAIIITPDIVFGVFKQISPQTIFLIKLLCVPLMVAALGNIPYLFTLYTVKRPDIVLYSNILFIIAVSSICYFGLPKYGLVAAPVSILAAYACNVTFLYIFMQSYIKNLKKE